MILLKGYLAKKKKKKLICLPSMIITFLKIKNKTENSVYTLPNNDKNNCS